MTSVNVTTNKTQVNAVTNGVQGVVTIGTIGPQGVSFSSKELDESNVANNSVIYYDEFAGKYKANTTWTASTLTDGGNF